MHPYYFEYGENDYDGKNKKLGVLGVGIVYFS